MIAEGESPDQSELPIEGEIDNKSGQPPVEQVTQGEQTAEATQAELILTQEVARKAVDRALQDYVIAYHDKDRQKMEAIQAAVAQNEQLSDLFSQRIEQLKQVEQRVLADQKKYIYDFVVSKFGSVLRDISQSPRNSLQAIGPNQFGQADSDIRSFNQAVGEVQSMHDLLAVIQRGEVMITAWYDQATKASRKIADLNRGYPPDSVVRQVHGIRSAGEALVKSRDDTKRFLSQMRNGGYSGW